MALVSAPVSAGAVGAGCGIRFVEDLLRPKKHMSGSQQSFLGGGGRVCHTHGPSQDGRTLAHGGCLAATLAIYRLLHGLLLLDGRGRRWWCGRGRWAAIKKTHVALHAKPSTWRDYRTILLRKIKRFETDRILSMQPRCVPGLGVCVPGLAPPETRRSTPGRRPCLVTDRSGP